jgi:hypothetical protein
MGQIFSAITGISAAKKQKNIAKRQAAAAEAQAAAEKEQQRIAQVRANLETRKEKQNQLREARIRRAQILTGAIESGAAGSSAAQSAVAGIGTQFGANIGRINVAQGFGEATSQQREEAATQATEINRLQGKSNVIAAQQAVFENIGSLGDSLFTRFGLDKKIQDKVF